MMAVKAPKRPKTTPVRIELSEKQAIDLLLGGPDSPVSDAEITAASSSAVNKVRKAKAR